ncbi:maleylpyruvate isomerase family mycothiol-dependent enzyme [Cellulosimicrobium arenosum]|uniref:Maleylpyruvate isomerase family mycothiol-dependent enzyme n=1 Tax=Cellulosimicrobium arenosum TaxID=2708133 RepID=A0A927IW19_9MICO|nr:maleylpyruvate isomerase family mycothiol-dependent enzyme [Cellulosimicrobium arenosum]MBD8077451.1 maleylpyruvate isomerase family mycothiol-dependent enzyme [Cellulosimicrobium arenosum]
MDVTPGTSGPDHLDLLDLLARLQVAFLADVRVADPTARVPACGRWRVRNLVEHLGRIHHWAAAQAARRQETPLGRGPFDLAPFYAEHAAELREALAVLDADARAWTLLENDDPASTVRFWHRRQVHETLVHLHDLRAAAGGTVEDVPPAVWADTVDEVVTLLLPRQVRLGRTAPTDRAVALEATDAGRTWSLGSGAPAVRLSGPARGLALVLWRRLPPDPEVVPGLDVDGDGDALVAALAGRPTP